MHLCGNLNHRVGVGGNNYERNRSAEFSNKNIPKQDLTRTFTNALNLAQIALKRVTGDKLSEKHNICSGFPDKDTGDLIAPVVTHFRYHVGQAVTKAARIERVCHTS